MLALECPQQHSMTPGCTFCVITIPCECALSTQQVYFPPQLSSCEKNSTAITKLYPVNLALLQNFFNSSRLAAFYPDTVFVTPIQVNIPSFKMYNHTMSNLMTADAKDHLSLRKMVNATKHDQIIYKSLTEPLLAGIITPNTRGLEIPSILAYISFAFTIVILFLLGLVFLRLRKLTFALMLLSGTPVSKSQHVPIIHYESQNLDNAVPDLSSTCSVFQYDSNVFSMLLLLCLTLILIRFIYRKIYTNHTTISVELTTGSSCVSIPLLHLPLCPPYWSIEYPSKLSNFSVKGRFSPKLNVSWTVFHVTNRFTDKVLIVPDIIPISYLQAYKITKILKRPFIAFLTLTHDGHRQVADLHTRGNIEMDSLYSNIPSATDVMT